MKQRCSDPNHNSFHRYGARGIEVKYASFAAFIEYMGEKPSPSHTIDRIDNDGHYEPGNCRWATREEQNDTSRRNTP